MKSSILHYTIKQEETLELFIKKSLSYTTKKIQSLIKQNSLLLNDRPISSIDTVLKEKDILTVNLFKSYTTLNILYEDKDYIAVNKDYHLLTIGTEKEKFNTLYHKVSTYLKARDKNGKVFIIHRLDYDTSGIVLLAKNMKAKMMMQESWENVTKIYDSIVVGLVPNDSGTIKSFLAENKQHEVYEVSDPKEGKQAITKYKVIEKSKTHTLLKIQILTGRKNQIRLAMLKISKGILGETKYADNEAKRLYLHASELRFKNPITMKDITIVCPSKFKVKNLYEKD